MKSLKKFIESEMKMTSFYQPLIILSLLKGKGKLEEIAALAIELKLTEKDIKDALKIHPKQVLAKHGIAKLEKGIYSFESLIIDANEADCLSKLSKFIK